MYKPGSQFKVKVKYARNLHDTETFGKMDPYVQVVLGSREARTKEKKDAGVNPVFEEELVLDFQNEAEVDFRVFDSESMGSDKFIGEARISVQAVINNGGSWAGDLQLYRGGKKPAGLLNVHIFLIHAEPVGSPSHVPAAAATSGVYPDMPAMNPNYQPGAPPPQPQMASAMPVYAQPVYGQPVMAQAVVAQPTVYAQPAVVYAQPQVVIAQPQVVYQPPGPTYVYRQY